MGFSLFWQSSFELSGNLMCLDWPSKSIPNTHIQYTCLCLYYRFLWVHLFVLPHLRKLVANSISGSTDYVNEGRQLVVRGGWWSEPGGAQTHKNTLPHFHTCANIFFRTIWGDDACQIKHWNIVLRTWLYSFFVGWAFFTEYVGNEGEMGNDDYMWTATQLHLVQFSWCCSMFPLNNLNT